MDPLTQAASECDALGAASTVVRSVDVADADAVGAAVDDILGQFGRIDAVVHSAGVVAYGRFEEVPATVFDTVLRTNTLGSANIARAVLPSMRERDSGSVVLIGSLIGHIAPPYMSAYAVSKWAVRGLARELSIENRDRPGVSISLVAPGGVDTPIYLQAANYLGWVGRPPLPVVSPEKVARVALAMLDRPRARVQVGSTNGLITLGFTALPGLYDALVTPLFTAAATDRRQRVEPGSGNVMNSVPDSNRLRGDQGSAVLSLVANVWEAAKLRVRGNSNAA
jgi:short-subunit dehydrogenase